MGLAEALSEGAELKSRLRHFADFHFFFCHLYDVELLIVKVLHGGVAFEDLDKENALAVEDGLCNLAKHGENMRKYGVPVLIAVNRFPSDTDNEINKILSWADFNHYVCSVNSAALDGSAGSRDLAEKVMNVLGLEDVVEGLADFKPLYTLYSQGDSRNSSIDDKIGYICREIYGAENVEIAPEAFKQIKQYEEMGYGHLPVCISKTPNSLTDDPKVLGAPIGFTIHIREVRLYAA